MELNARVVPEMSEDIDQITHFRNAFSKEVGFLREENRILKQNLLTF